jgi:hypothetical protein
MTYKPKPIDTSQVSLSPDILQLTEVLARNTHDNWAEQRIAEGWQYGPERDDDGKTHPCLVAYDQLPESEKEYDRRTVMETLKAILALGYSVTKPQRIP